MFTQKIFTAKARRDDEEHSYITARFTIKLHIEDNASKIESDNFKNTFERIKNIVLESTENISVHSDSTTEANEEYEL